ncbi:unnamed protein product [Toxocara canis]|uniref:PPE family protein n=1 Tax=Toxocara canis TaxID=6265 RepID=A0A183V426_TOXCA|nr:unnamed protein product [Toxocara canis]
MPHSLPAATAAKYATAVTSTNGQGSDLTATGGANPSTLAVMGYQASWMSSTPTVQQRQLVSFGIPWLSFA